MRAVILPAVLLAACGEPPVVPVDSSPAPTPTDRCIVWPGDWQGGTTRDDSAGVTITRAGDVIVYGYEFGRLGIENIEPAGEPRGYVARMAGHRWGWRWLLPAAYGGTVDAVDVRDDGLLQVSGRIREPPPTDERAQYQLFLGQLDANGELVEYAELERPSERPRQSASTNGWNAVAGYLETYVPTNYVASVEDPFLVTWRDGDLQHARITPFQTRWFDVVDGVAVDPDGNVTVVGASRGGDASGAFARRFAPDGQVMSTEWISKGPLESLSAIRRLPDGDVVVAGSTWLPLDGQPTAGKSRKSPGLQRAASVTCHAEERGRGGRSPSIIGGAVVFFSRTLPAACRTISGRSCRRDNRRHLLRPWRTSSAAIAATGCCSSCCCRSSGS